MPRIALYPGSFDPVTNGHLDVVRHAVMLCDKLVIAIGIQHGKTPLFTVEERFALARQVFEPIANQAGCQLETTTFDNLVVVAARKLGAALMVRGLRDSTDLNYEMQLAGLNETMAPEVHTVFVPASAATRPIASSIIKQIAEMGGDISAFVPAVVAASLKTKFKR
jgi:pantetheine-phosphate adenylyltransferase